MPIRAFVVVLPMLIFLLAGCGAPPRAEADAARQSMASSSTAGAEKHAAASLKDETLKPSVATLSQQDRSLKVRQAAIEALKVMG